MTTSSPLVAHGIPKATADILAASSATARHRASAWTITGSTAITGHVAVFLEDGTEYRDMVPAVIHQTQHATGRTRAVAAVFDADGCLVPVSDAPFGGEFAGIEQTRGDAQ